MSTSDESAIVWTAATRSAPVAIRRPLQTLVLKETAQGVRARWLLVHAALFLLAGLLLAGLGVGRTGLADARMALRSTAGVLQLVLLVLPPIALLQGVSAIADDRESGMLEYLLAQPVSAGLVYGARWVGATLLLTVGVTLGLAPGATGALARGAPPALLLELWALAILLGLTFLGLGLAAAAAGGRARALVWALGLWLGLTVLGSLGLMALLVRARVPADVLMGWSLLNPVEAFRLGLLIRLDADLSILGPVGVALVERLGPTGVRAAAFASLAGWASIPGLLGAWRFRRSPVG